MRVPIRGVHCAAVVGAVLLLSIAAGPVKADATVTAKFTDLQSGATASDQAGGGGGVFNWTGTPTVTYTDTSIRLGTVTTTQSGSNPITPTNGTVFQTFCIETNEFINYGQTQTYDLKANADLAHAPVTNGGQFQNTGGMGAAAAKNLELLFGKFYYNSTDGYATQNSTKYTGFSAGISGGIDYSALQLAIWTIVNHSNGTTDDLSVPDDYSAYNNSQVISDYTAMINYVNSSAAQTSGPLADYLVALTAGENNQDQLGINVGGGITPLAVPTPCPPGIVLGLIGIVGMGGYGWRRRRLLGR